MIDRLLIANRGEIAVRIIKTCRRLGIRSVVVYSQADRHSRAVQEADEGFFIGPSSASASYLNIPAIIQAAQRTEVQAVHPGFGFLAENADFAQACRGAGFLFVGPSVESIRALGSKARAKALAEQVGVPILPGYQGQAQDDDILLAQAELIGYPVMVKAAAGGGGKGMRRVAESALLPAAVQGARAEALSSFGDSRLILEKCLDRPRHIEVQILGDQHGKIIHLGERDCSLQRRHQKILEETPAPDLSEELRWHMQRCAIKIASAAGYSNAGTVEFLLQDKQFYFLEMNTRLQVEHPVTEAVTGIDLVEWQLRIAQGEALLLDSPQPHGHSIEVRLYAEDPERDYHPCTGTVALWREPPDMRVDSGLQQGEVITPFYDSMLAKLIVWGEDRASALRRLLWAVESTCLLGITTNQNQLAWLLRHSQVRQGAVDTGFLSREWPVQEPTSAWQQATRVVAVADSLQGTAEPRAWRNNPGPVLPLQFCGRSSVSVQPSHEGAFLSVADEFATCRVEVIEFEPPHLVVQIDGHRKSFVVLQEQDKWWVWSREGTFRLETVPRFPQDSGNRGGETPDGLVRAPLTGSVSALLVEVGQVVEAGQALLRMEAMKMEHTLVSSRAGQVGAIHCAMGEVVEAHTLLIVLQA